MCLISIVPSGTEKNIDLISSFIKRGMLTNTDGSGYAIKKNGTLFLNKGFREEDDIIKAIKSHDLGINDELVIHHRIGTSGSKNDINMHPFIVTEDMKELQTVNGFTDKPIMAHNGVFHAFTDHNSAFSDTFHFIQQFISEPEFVAYLSRDPKSFEKKLSKILMSNKLAFLFKNRDLVMLGDFKEDEGCFHSNSGYKTTIYNVGGVESKSYPQHAADTRYPKTFSTFKSRGQSKMDFDQMSEEEWVVDHDIRLGQNQGIDNKLENGSSRNLISKVPNKYNPLKTVGLSFEPRDIKITEDNYKHFIFIVKSDYSPFMLKNKGFEIMEYDMLSDLNPIVAKSHIKEINYVDVQDFVNSCLFYVKSEYRELYKGLYNLIQAHGYSPSRSTVKKINAILGKKYLKDSFKFKEYGVFFYDDLHHYHDQVKKNKAPNDYSDLVETDNDFPAHQFSTINERLD